MSPPYIIMSNFIKSGPAVQADKNNLQFFMQKYNIRPVKIQKNVKDKLWRKMM